jgi:hypothetical protein
VVFLNDSLLRTVHREHRESSVPHLPSLHVRVCMYVFMYVCTYARVLNSTMWLIA